MKRKQKSVKKVLEHCDRWDNMYKRLGAYGVAKLMMKTKSYKDYCNKYPYDYVERWATVKQIDEMADFLPDDRMSVEEEVDAKLEYEKFVDGLTPRQNDVFQGLLSGMKNSEIEAGLGFNSNNTVRWYKHKIKHKYLETAYHTINEYICKECAWQWRASQATKCPQCNNKSILITRKNIPDIKDI